MYKKQIHLIQSHGAAAQQVMAPQNQATASKGREVASAKGRHVFADCGRGKLSAFFALFFTTQLAEQSRPNCPKEVQIASEQPPWESVWYCEQLKPQRLDRLARLYLVEAKIVHERQGFEVTPCCNTQSRMRNGPSSEPWGQRERQAKCDLRFCIRFGQSQRNIRPDADHWNLLQESMRGVLLQLSCFVRWSCAALLSTRRILSVLGHTALACFKNGPSRYRSETYQNLHMWYRQEGFPYCSAVVLVQEALARWGRPRDSLEAKLVPLLGTERSHPEFAKKKCIFALRANVKRMAPLPSSAARSRAPAQIHT